MMQTSGFSDNTYGNCEIKELEEQRYLTFRGKVPTKYFVKRLYGEEDSFVLYYFEFLLKINYLFVMSV